MPPILALSITIIFIVFLLRLDRKQNTTASFALWIPTIWMLLTSKSIGYWIGGYDISSSSSSSSAEEGDILNVIFIGTICLVGLMILIKRQFNWINGIKNNLWLITLISFLLISVFWSDMVLVSFKRWFRGLFVAIVMAFVVTTEVNPRRALESIFRRLIYIQIPLSIVLIKYYQDLGIQFNRWTGERTWIGVATQKNGLALRCMFAMFFLLWIFIRRLRNRDISVAWYQKYIEVFIFMLATYLFMGPTHKLTTSATSFVCIVIGSTGLFCLYWLKRRNIIPGVNTLTVGIVFIIVYGTIIPFIGGLGIFDVSSLLGRESNLTGRGEIWQILISAAKQKLYFGYGFGGFWTDEWIKVMKVNEAHNGYLDSILNSGIIGLILISVYLILSCRKTCQEITQDPDWGLWGFCIILMAVIQNLTESTLYSLRGLMLVVIFLDVSLRVKTYKLVVTMKDGN